MKRRFLLGLIVLIVGLAAGCARPIENEAAKQIKAALPGYLGPADNYDVHVKGDSMGALMRGRVRSVHIEGTKVQVQPTLILDKMTLDFEEISVDAKGRRLQNIGQATYDCRVKSSVLDDYLRQQHPEIVDLKVALRADSIFVSARPDALGLVEAPLNINIPGKLKVPVTVEGKLSTNDGTFLNFNPEKAAVSIIPVPQFALDYLAKKINPVVNLSNMKVPIQAEKVFVRGEYLYFSGSIRPDDILKLQK